tara:strand:- start:19 stop:780 length:762 start_codon:yes stop_codon:yes gene_type:complete
MGFYRGPHIITDGLIFAWNGTGRSWTGVTANTTHYDLVGSKTGTKTGSDVLSIISDTDLQTVRSVDFDNASDGTRTCYIEFPSANITVPTGDTGTWVWAQYFEDAGNVDHPNFGKETGSGWDGDDGFVFGTGWGTDGPRWGIAGTAFTVYADVGSSTGDYRAGVWQMYGVTYQRDSATGVKSYLFDSNGQRLIDERASSDVAIGSNSNTLNIGATNSRGGNWNGLMDWVLMYDSVLTQEQIFQNFNNLNRYGL